MYVSNVSKRKIRKRLDTLDQYFFIFSLRHKEGDGGKQLYFIFLFGVVYTLMYY